MQKGLNKGLGKGLGALFGDIGIDTNETDKEKEPKKVNRNSNIAFEQEDKKEYIGKVFNLKITEVEPNQNQPRKTFDLKKIEELAESISVHGVIQPILVKKNKHGYEIIAGERRWRAAKQAGLVEIPAIIKEYDDKKVSEVALIENIQRENLNAIEQAKAFKGILDEYTLTQEDLSKAIGKNRATIANMMRLLSLSDTIQKMVEKGDLSESQARCLLVVKDEGKRELLANKVVAEGITVKQLEAIVYEKTKVAKGKIERKVNTKNKIIFDKIEDRLNEYFMTKVNLKAEDKKGKIVIEYYSNDDLNRILDKLDISI